MFVLPTVVGNIAGVGNVSGLAIIGPLASVPEPSGIVLLGNCIEGVLGLGWPGIAPGPFIPADALSSVNMERPAADSQLSRVTLESVKTAAQSRIRKELVAHV
jgi:hypothetical protein